MLKTNSELQHSRRTFLKTLALTGGGFVVGAGTMTSLAHAMEAEESAALFNAFVKVLPDNTVTVIIKHLDKGQGVTTGLTTIVAEEMDADWAQMRWEFAPADASRYNNLAWGPMQGTGGSSSIRNSWMQLREAGAAAKTMLLDAAATAWGTKREALTVSDGVITFGEERATFGELAAAAAKITPRDVVPLKSAKDFKLIGQRLPRIDSAEKSTGAARYTSDLALPDMLHAAVIHPPRFGQKLLTFDAEQARAGNGVIDVFAIPSGVAIVAETFWQALKAKKLVQTSWDETTGEQRSSSEISTALREKFDEAGAVAVNRGDAEQAIKNAAEVIEVEYEFPFLAHASMEPLNAIVQVNAGRCEIWTGCQSQTRDQAGAAQVLGIPPEAVKINTVFAGGSFGRRAVPDSDYVLDAVHIAKALGKPNPVKLQWTREEDMRGGRYRPVSLHRMRAGLDAEGNVLAWHHRVIGQSFLKGTAFESMIKDGVDGTLVEGARGLPYAIDNFQVDTHLVETGVPTLWWRSVGHTHNGFATEAFFDEVAHKAGKDPLALRLSLLKDHPRHLGVLRLAAEKAGDAPQGAGKGRGFAVHESFRSFVAQVVDVTINDDGTFAVDRVVAAVDCGVAINPDIVVAQIEGGIGYGLSAMLRESIMLDDGKVAQANFDTYRPLRINEMPVIDVHIVSSTEAPSGVGEPGLPPLAPAVANAIRQASGKSIRRLPFDKIT